MRPEQYDDEHDLGVQVDDTCPVCGGTEAHSDDCTICNECGGDCSAKGKGHSSTCSNWDGPDYPGWEGGFAENH